ncbi:MAG: TonB-dependent siderophore receptor [Novosphingobium sp.]|nr:TonB-dependent siderophore receptor [Novosphingobium sp.]
MPAAANAKATQSSEASVRRYDFDIPSQTLAKALTSWAQTTGNQTVWVQEEPATVASAAVHGKMTAQEALGRLLAGTGFTYEFVDATTVRLRRLPANAADGEVVTGVVSVEGAQGSPYFGGAGQAAGVNGTNGSRDITATEGTGSFTSGALTIGSKVPQALKDVPQSVSVLTSERLEQQNVTDFTSAMKQLPGVTLVQGTGGLTNLENTFYSRGFAITSIQVDGGAPLSTNFGFYPQIDMSVYDHVELLRGADGTFNGYGEPGGTVNLVRKKPLDHTQFAVDAQAGSWSNYRVTADATAPLALDGRLRGRLIMTWQDNHYFYNTAKDDKALIYGIAEFDASPTTLLTVGVNHTRQDSVPWYDGLPRYQDGSDLGLPRSTSLVFPWNRASFDTTEIFGGIEQKLGGDWVVKLNLTRLHQTSMRKLGASAGSVNPLTGAGPTLVGIYEDQANRQLSTEATLTGSFEVFGQRQELAMGISRVASDGGGQVNHDTLVSGTADEPYVPYAGGPEFYYGSPNGYRPPVDVLHFDPNDPLYTEPRNTLPNLRFLVFKQIQTIGYINLRLTAFDHLHLTTGVRWSRYAFVRKDVSLCTEIPTTGDPSDTNCVGREIGDAYNPTDTSYAASDISWPPSVTLSYDITHQLTAYAGYTDIYQSQADEYTRDLVPVDPVTGSNIEAGLKWEARDGRLNLSVAAYQIQEKGFATYDWSSDRLNPDGSEYTDPVTGAWYSVDNNGNFYEYGQVDSNHHCCYIGNPNSTLKSQGVDVEITGELARGWQISASYTYDRTKQIGSDYGRDEGAPFVTLQPKHNYKFWTSYDFGARQKSGFLSGLVLSAGVNGQSSAYRSGSACTDLGPPDALGMSDCLPGATVPFAFTVPAYAVVSGRIDYRISRTWSLAVNLENILDKTYYQAVGSVSSGNWYGTPRSFTASLRAKW